jgi:hypothetical protein
MKLPIEAFVYVPNDRTIANIQTETIEIMTKALY